MHNSLTNIVCFSNTKPHLQTDAFCFSSTKHDYQTNTHSIFLIHHAPDIQSYKYKYKNISHDFWHSFSSVLMFFSPTSSVFCPLQQCLELSQPPYELVPYLNQGWRWLAVVELWHPKLNGCEIPKDLQLCCEHHKQNTIKNLTKPEQNVFFF